MLHVFTWQMGCVCVCWRKSVVDMSSAFNNFLFVVIVVAVVVHYYFTLVQREWAHDCSYATAAIECDNRAEMDKLFVWLWRCLVEDNWYLAATKYSNCKCERARAWTRELQREKQRHRQRCIQNDLNSGAIFNFHKFIFNFPVPHKRDTHTQSPTIKVIISKEIERRACRASRFNHSNSILQIFCRRHRMFTAECWIFNAFRHRISLGE